MPQFETIHPYANGNGRIGRALVGWSLRRRGAATAVVPPLSPQIARRVDQYVYGLWAYREDRLDDWVAWFAEMALAAAEDAASLETQVTKLVVRWRSELEGRRSDDTARRLIEVLPALPVVDVAEQRSPLESVTVGAASSERAAEIRRARATPATVRGRRPAAQELDCRRSRRLDLASCSKRTGTLTVCRRELRARKPT